MVGLTVCEKCHKRIHDVVEYQRTPLLQQQPTSAYREGFDDAAAVARTMNNVAATTAAEGQSRFNHHPTCSRRSGTSCSCRTPATAAGAQDDTEYWRQLTQEANERNKKRDKPSTTIHSDAAREIAAWIFKLEAALTSETDLSVAQTQVELILSRHFPSTEATQAAGDDGEVGRLRAQLAEWESHREGLIELVETAENAVATARADAIRDAVECVPVNWLDTLLTGPDAVLPKGVHGYNCTDIERLLNGIRQRLESFTKGEGDNLAERIQRAAENIWNQLDRTWTVEDLKEVILSEIQNPVLPLTPDSQKE
jgi:hypothetical protein